MTVNFQNFNRLHAIGVKHHLQLYDKKDLRGKMKMLEFSKIT